MKNAVYVVVAVLAAVAPPCRADVFLPSGRMALGANYWASHAATAMWRKWDVKVVEEDLRILSENGIKLLRVFPNWTYFQPIHVCFLSGDSFDKVNETRMFDAYMRTMVAPMRKLVQSTLRLRGLCELRARQPAFADQNLPRTMEAEGEDTLII